MYAIKVVICLKLTILPKDVSGKPPCNHKAKLTVDSQRYGERN